MNGRRPTVWAVVPVKEIALAKQRLAMVLDAAARQELALCMLEDVLRSLAAVPGLAGVLVSTVDPRARSLADRLGARTLTEGAADGLSAAVAAAGAVLAAEGVDAMLVLPGDIPLATPAEIAAVLDAHRETHAAILVPAHGDGGTNALLCAPPDALPFQFGEDSFVRHLDSAQRLGLGPQVLDLPGIALDIDRPEDLEAFMRMPSRTGTWSFLAGRDLLPVPATRSDG